MALKLQILSYNILTPMLGGDFNWLFLDFLNWHLVGGTLGIKNHFKKEIGSKSQKKVSPSNLKLIKRKLEDLWIISLFIPRKNYLWASNGFLVQLIPIRCFPISILNTKKSKLTFLVLYVRVNSFNSIINNFRRRLKLFFTLLLMRFSSLIY